VTFFTSLLAGTTVLGGCRKDRADANAGQANADDASSVVAGPNADSVKESLEALRPRVSAMNANFTSLHKQFDPLPPNLPGFGDVRVKFYATDEGMGIVGSKLTLLSDRLDAALKSGNREELQKVSKDIATTNGEIDEIDRIRVELMHQVSPFERMVRLHEMEISGITPFTSVLPTSYEVLGTKDGVEQRLLDFIEDSKRTVDKNSWLEFDHLRFSGDGLDIHSDVSEHQVRNVLEILKAYPAVTLKIGGFTDNASAPDDSKRHSAARAHAVEEELVRLGVAPQRLDAQGYGAEHPVCPANDTDACRSRNRRVAVLVITK
jgi:hypothetical protein